MRLFELRKANDGIFFRALRQGESLEGVPHVLSGLEELRDAGNLSALVCSERYILPCLYVLCGGSPSDLPPSAEWLDYPSPFSPSALPTDKEALRRTVMGFPLADSLHRLVVSWAHPFDFLPLVQPPVKTLRDPLLEVLWKKSDLPPEARQSLHPKISEGHFAIYKETEVERSGFLHGLLSFAERHAGSRAAGLSKVLKALGRKPEGLGLETAFQARMVVLEIYPVPSGGVAVHYVSPFDPRLNDWPGAETRVAVVASFHEREAARLGYLVAPLVLVIPHYAYLPVGGIPVALWWHDQWVLKAGQGKREDRGEARRKNRVSRFVRDENEIYRFLFEAIDVDSWR
jgi:hypothetical protein